MNQNARQKPIYKTPAGERVVMAVYDRILGEWPEATESLEIATAHGVTHVLAQGPTDAPVLLLLHGAGSNALAWGGDVPELARRFRVYAVDTPGEPGRSCHERIPWEGTGIVDWLGEVIDGLSVLSGSGGLGDASAAEVVPVLLAGISQGGYIALRFATARPKRVRALAVLAPGGVSPVKPGFLVRGITYSLLGRWGSGALVRYIMDDEGVPEVAMDYMDLIFTHFRSRMDPQPLLTDAELRRLNMPVLLAAGGRDKLFDSAKTVVRFERLVADADVRVLPEAGHALVNVARELIPFFEKAATD